MGFSADSAVGLSREHGITPKRCGTPHCRHTGWDQATDDGEPYDTAIFRCLGCGRYTAMSRRSVVRRIRAEQRREG